MLAKLLLFATTNAFVFYIRSFFICFCNQAFFLFSQILQMLIAQAKSQSSYWDMDDK